MSQFTNILVATDGSRSSEAAVEKGLELASQTGAGLTFLHVVEPIASGAERVALPASRPQWSRSRTAIRLDGAREPARAVGVQA